MAQIFIDYNAYGTMTNKNEAPFYFFLKWRYSYNPSVEMSNKVLIFVLNAKHFYVI